MRDGNIKDLLKYWTAERFKSLQRKLTTAKNTILKDALSRELEPFYSQEEKSRTRQGSQCQGGEGTRAPPAAL